MSSPHSRSKQTLKVGDLVYLKLCTCGERGLPRKLHYGRITSTTKEGVIVSWLDATYTLATAPTTWDLVEQAYAVTTQEELALMLLSDEKGDTWNGAVDTDDAGG